MQQVPRQFLDNYISARADIIGNAQGELKASLALIDFSRPVDEWRDAVIAIMDAICGGASQMAAMETAIFYDGLRERVVGETMGAIAQDGRSAEATEKSTRAFIGKVFDAGVDKFVDLCCDRIDYEVKRAGSKCIAYNERRDPEYVRYARVPDGSETCDFCLMLASRGPVYHTEKDAGSFEHWHSHCDCMVVPFWNTYVARAPDGHFIGRRGQTTIEGYDPDALYDRYLDLKISDDNFAERMARAAELARMRNPESGKTGRPSARQRQDALSEAMEKGDAIYHDLHEMGEAIKHVKTYEDLAELVDQLNKELPYHFPTSEELEILKDKLRARRKQLISD